MQRILKSNPLLTHLLTSWSGKLSKPTWPVSWSSRPDEPWTQNKTHTHTSTYYSCSITTTKIKQKKSVNLHSTVYTWLISDSKQYSKVRDAIFCTLFVRLELDCSPHNTLERSSYYLVILQFTGKALAKATSLKTTRWLRALFLNVHPDPTYHPCASISKALHTHQYSLYVALRWLRWSATHFAVSIRWSASLCLIGRGTAQRVVPDHTLQSYESDSQVCTHPKIQRAVRGSNCGA